MKLLGGFLAAIALLTLALHWRDSRLERRLEPVATEVAGRPAKVRCQGFWANLIDVQWRAGSVMEGSNEMFLTRGTCARLRRFLDRAEHAVFACLRSAPIEAYYGPARDPAARPCLRKTRWAEEAVRILAHESYHVAGIADEAATECYAIQATAFTAARLGADPADAAALARLAFVSLPLMPAEYRSDDCVAGGELDLHPQTPAFPTEDTLVAPRGAVAPAN